MDIIYNDRDPAPACANCEYATPPHEDDTFVFCMRYHSEISVEGACRYYIYDLTRRTSLPMRLKHGLDDVGPIDF